MNFNLTTKSPKVLENISKFILIIADLNKDNRLIMSMKQFPLECFKPVAFFPGHLVHQMYYLLQGMQTLS